MAVRTKKLARKELEEPESRGPRDNQPRYDEEQRDDEEEFDAAELSVVTDLRPPHEPDPREVENVTDRIFKSVLSRYGWELHDGHIEHIGEEHRRRR
jgi:hypothetical protein